MTKTSLPVSFSSRYTELWSLTKPKVVQLIVFCAIIGMLLSIEGMPTPGEWCRILIASISIWCISSAAAVINCLLESHIDVHMKRTSWRPTAQATVEKWQVISFAFVLSLAGTILLSTYINTLTLWLTLGSLVGYAGIYTVILKPLTPQNIVIGGAAGATPPVLGWAAIHGSLSIESLLLFLIIFLWTPPHFWALALYRVEDYKKSGLPMLPVTHGTLYTARHIFFYTIALLVASVTPTLMGFLSWLYLTVAVVTGVIFCLYGYGLWKNYSDALARKTFRWSLWHLSLLFLAMLLDHYLL